MKKILMFLLALSFSTGMIFAQQPTPVKKPTTVNKAGAPTKKDGTPDMRFKVNKETKVAGPKKKDGTPDMRYKANKKN